MAILTQPTGADIISILVSSVGGGEVFIGDLSATDIDADVSSNGDRSILVQEFNRQRALYPLAGLDPDVLTDQQLADGETALYWATYCQYLVNDWTKKKIHDPDKCEPLSVVKQKKTIATGIVCEHFRRLGISDDVFCGNLWSITSSNNSFCFDTNC